ncbi:hypothetical protein EK21DRAFT_67578 [Setomelanomma holmii]|uniref:Zn(2)-C6 fungal-type domain-containing protein n=1 Tax=Setomelanomma holmii TaxID=210430 RepID=A0A9P4LL64_9PLEO|nr:hypothetical protein EK21DRAFT_67578 [Setomelanomma holmii]
MQFNEASTSDSSAATQLCQRQRLPVNPRRVKVPQEQRKRVVRACNACNIRRVKCSGGQPCERCSKVSRPCEYPAPESDKSALKNEVEYLRKRCASLEQRLQLSSPDDAADVLRELECGELATCPTTPSFHSSSSGATDADSEDGRLLWDLDGTPRYLGKTSGATFLDVLKRFMWSLVPLTFAPEPGDGSSFVRTIGHYQTFDSRPLPNPEVDPLWLPSQTLMTAMLAELRYYIQDGSGNMPCGGIYWWGDLNTVPASLASSASLNAMTTDDSFRYLAFYHVCFALAASVGSFRHSEHHTCEHYFKRARVLIGNPLDTVRFTLTDVPVLSLMAFYLIEINRRDAAYMYVGLAIRIAVIHGAFKSCDDEASKRRFWTLYILDRWLSVLMGRPPTIADEAIRLPLPYDVPSMPPSAGLRAHVELAKISGYIVCETFKVAPRNCRPGAMSTKTDVALKMLQTWRDQLPPALQISENPAQLDPSCGLLHMAHNQLIVLTTRPIFFAAVKQAVAQRLAQGHPSPEPHRQARHIQACSTAAHRNLLLAQLIIQSKRKLLQAGLHFVFNAAVVLLLNRIMTAEECPKVEAVDGTATGIIGDQFASCVDSAIRIFEEEARTGTNYPRDCCNVLRDLKALTDRYLATWNQSQMHQKNFHNYVANTHLAQIGHDSTMGLQGNAALLSKSEGFYGEISSWTQSDGLQPLLSL